MERRECRRKVLSENSNCLVERCACDVLHVTFGAVTLRMAREAAIEFAQTLNDAIRRLQLSDFGGDGPLRIAPAGGGEPS